MRAGIVNGVFAELIGVLRLVASAEAVVGRDDGLWRVFSSEAGAYRKGAWVKDERINLIWLRSATCLRAAPFACNYLLRILAQLVEGKSSLCEKMRPSIARAHAPR